MLQIINVLFLLLFSFTSAQAIAESAFTHAIIKLPFEVQTETTWSRVITSQEQWQQFYDENKTYVSAIPFPHVPPIIDFELFTIVVGGLSWRYSHSDIVVQNVHTKSPNVLLQIAILSYGKNCVLTANVTYPNIAVMLPRPVGDLQISTEVYVKDCPE